MHGQLQTCSSVDEACTVSGSLAWMAFLGFESSYFCPIVNIATYTSVNVIFVYVPTIYFPYKVVTKFRFQCSISTLVTRSIVFCGLDCLMIATRIVISICL